MKSPSPTSPVAAPDATEPTEAPDCTGATVPEPVALTEHEKTVMADLPWQYARVTTHSVMAASRVIEAAERSTSVGKTADWRGAMEELQAAAEKLRSNDLSQAEEMLMHQAIGLNALHVRLTEMAFQAMASPHLFDVFLRYSLRAQAQGRATLEALAEIKNPPVLFARQANISNGPQQINNGEPSRARENGSEHNELSGEASELPADTGTPALTRGADSAMAPVGAVNRPQVSRRQGAIVSKRLERRDARHAPKSAASAGATKK